LIGAESGNGVEETGAAMGAGGVGGGGIGGTILFELVV
jgi:hypothetical protein